MTKLLIISVAAIICLFIIIIFINEKKEINNLNSVKITYDKSDYQLYLPCNRFNYLELSFEINPPLQYDNYREIKTLVTGSIEIDFIKNDIIDKREKIDLVDTGSYTSNGLWKKPIIYFKPKFSLFCTPSILMVKIKNLNVDLDKHVVILHVKKDLRP